MPARAAAVRTPLLFVAGLAVLLAGCAWAAVATFVAVPRPDPAVAARVATDAFVTRLVAGEYGQAYDRLCRATRARVDRADFETSLAGRPPVLSYQIDGVQAVAEGFLVRVTLVGADAAGQQQSLTVVRDGGSFKICGTPLAAGAD